MWVSLGAKGAEQKTSVTAGAFRVGPFDSEGATALVKFTAYFNGAWQSQSVLSLVGEGGKKLHGHLFKLTDPDVTDSDKLLDAKFTLALPQMAPETNAITIVKHAVLTVPGLGRSATDIEENLALFTKPGTGVTRGKGWSATTAGTNLFNVAYDFMDGSNGEQQAIWSVNTVTKQVKYVNHYAKLFSWTPNY